MFKRLILFIFLITLWFVPGLHAETQGISGIINFSGLSTDTKPLVNSQGIGIPNGSWYWETDTGLSFRYDAKLKRWVKSTVDTHDAHVHRDMWNHFAYRNTGDSSTLASGVSKGDTSVTLVDATGFITGSFIDLHLGTRHSHIFHKVTNVVSNTLTLDRQIDEDHAAGSTVNEVVFSLHAAVGSLGSPVIYKMIASPGEIIHINRFLVTIEHETAGDLSKFGSRDALPNGLHVRVNRNNGEEYETYTIWRTNKDMKEDMYDVEFTDKAGGGNHGTSGRWTLTNADVVIRLDGDNNDSVEYLVQDDMTTGAELLDFQIKGQAHYEKGGRD